MILLIYYNAAGSMFLVEVIVNTATQRAAVTIKAEGCDVALQSQFQSAVEGAWRSYGVPAAAARPPETPQLFSQMNMMGGGGGGFDNSTTL